MFDLTDYLFLKTYTLVKGSETSPFWCA